MRIGLSSSVIQRGRTGIAQYFFALLRAFLSSDSQHEFVVFVLEEDLPLFEPLKGRLEIIPVSEQFRPPVWNIWWHQTVLPRLARRHQLDLLHVPSYRRMAWSRTCPLVATIHDLAPFHVAGKYDWKRTFYGRVIARRLAQRQDRIIAVSQSTAQDVSRFFDIPEHRLAIIHNGLDHERFHPGSREAALSEVSHRHGLTQPFFLYLARLEHPGKNHVRLISAFDRFKQTTGSPWQLALAGSDWHGADVIHAAIRRSPFAADIRAPGFVADPQVPALYRAAGVFIYPSLYEGFGMPPTEAMACGCPVISSTRGSLGEVVGDAAAIVDPEDDFSIMEQMAALAGNAWLRNRLRTAGFAQAAKFRWDHAAERTLRVYENLAALGRGGALRRPRRRAERQATEPTVQA